MGLGHLEEVAEHPVVLNLERGDLGARALSRLDGGQGLAAAVSEPPLLVERRVGAFAHHAAIAGVRRRLLDQVRLQVDEDVLQQVVPDREQVGNRPVGAAPRELDQELLQLREHRQRAAQRAELPRVDRAQARPRGQADHVPHVLEPRLQLGPQRGLGHQRIDRVEAVCDDLSVPRGRAQPPPQQPSTHGGLRAVDRPQQRAPAQAVPQGSEQLEVADRSLVEDEMVGGLVASQAVQQQRLPGLGGLGIGEHHRRRDLFGLAEGSRPRLLRQRPHPPTDRGRRRLGVLEARHVRRERLGEPAVQPLLGDDLARIEARELGLRRGLARAQQHEVVGAGDVAQGQGHPALGHHHRGQVVGHPRLQVLLVDERSWRHHPDDLAPDDVGPLARLRLLGRLHLLADGDLQPPLHHRAQVTPERVVGDPGHRDRVLDALVAGGERDVQEGRDLDRVVEEQLVEVPHPKHQDRVRILRLDAEELPHHRGVGRVVRGGHGRIEYRSPPRFRYPPPKNEEGPLCGSPRGGCRRGALLADDVGDDLLLGLERLLGFDALGPRVERADPHAVPQSPLDLL